MSTKTLDERIEIDIALHPLDRNEEVLKDAYSEIIRLRKLAGEVKAKGWKLVPIKATDAMLDAGDNAWNDYLQNDVKFWGGMGQYYAAMMEAAPELR